MHVDGFESLYNPQVSGASHPFGYKSLLTLKLQHFVCLHADGAWLSLLVDQWAENNEYVKICYVVNDLKVVNDCAELCIIIKDIQKYKDTANDSNTKKYILLVVKINELPLHCAATFRITTLT